MDKIHSQRLARYEDKEYVLDEKLEKIRPWKSLLRHEGHRFWNSRVHAMKVPLHHGRHYELWEFQKSYEDSIRTRCIKIFLKERYHQHSRQERYEIFTNMISTKDGSMESLLSPCTCKDAGMLRIFASWMLTLGKTLAMDMVLHSLPPCSQSI